MTTTPAPVRFQTKFDPGMRGMVRSDAPFNRWCMEEQFKDALTKLFPSVRYNREWTYKVEVDATTGRPTKIEPILC
jgi:hypothetical protein